MVAIPPGGHSLSTRRISSCCKAPCCPISKACCDRIPTAREKPSVLRLNYNAWAARNGELMMSFSQFHDAVENCPDKTVRNLKSDGTRWVCGLSLKSNSEGRWEREP